MPQKSSKPELWCHLEVKVENARKILALLFMFMFMKNIRSYVYG